ncbi:MAG: DUF58 domain-containing protein [Anaerolineae bacterium]
MVARFLLPGGLLYGLLLAAVALLDGRMLILALPLGLYLLASLYYCPYQARLRATHSFSTDRAVEGARVDVELEIENEGQGIEQVLIIDRLPPGLELTAGRSAALASLPPDGRFSFSYTVRVARGGYTFQQVEAVASDLFGLFQRRLALPAPDQLLVLPRIVKLRSLAIRPLRTRSYAGPVPARQAGSGVDFYGVREYHPGDPRRWINWRLSARHPSGLFTNEFEQERIADVRLTSKAHFAPLPGIEDEPHIGDGSEVRFGGESLFEHAVQAAASLAGAFLDGGNRVGLLIYGRSLDWTFPGYGKIQRERIVQALARARTGDSQVFDRLDYLPTRFFPAQSQIVLVSPLWPDDVPTLVRLRARRYQILIVRPEVTLAARIAGLERSLMRRRLLQAGITVVDWHVDQSLDRAIYAAVGRTPLWTRAAGLEGKP